MQVQAAERTLCGWFISVKTHISKPVASNILLKQKPRDGFILSQSVSHGFILKAGFLTSKK